jgi:hypothetical protein
MLLLLLLLLPLLLLLLLMPVMWPVLSSARQRASLLFSGSLQ